MKKILITLGIVVVLGLLYMGMQKASNPLGSNASTNTNKCTVSTVASATVNGTASTVLSANLTRAWARLQSSSVVDGLIVNVELGSTADTSSGVRLTTSTPYIDLGLNTDIPFTGLVSAISTATTTLYITECTY